MKIDIRLNHKFSNLPKIGHWRVLRYHDRDHAGMFFTQSQNVRVENVNLYATGGLGILSQFCEHLEFMKVNFIPNPKTRMFLSGKDDGLHFSNCRGKILVVGWTFEGLMDDPMNVHGTSVKIEKIIPSAGSNQHFRVLGQFMHPQSIGFTWAQTGDNIAFVNRQSMQTLGTNKVSIFKLLTPYEFELEFETQLPMGIGEKDAMENLSWIPALEFRNNQVLCCRARGILISTSGKVIIENNYFKSSGLPILIVGDANNWWESGAVKDVIIRNNNFSEFCLTNMYGDCEAIISIAPVIPKLDYKTPFHRNIIIENNTFHPFDYPVLFARSTTNLTFQGNTIERSHVYAPWHPRKATISLDSCTNVILSENEIIGDVLGKNIQFKNMPSTEIQNDPNQQISIENSKKSFSFWKKLGFFFRYFVHGHFSS